MERCTALILAGGVEAGLGVLARHRAVAAMPFGGCYRVIDFPISNCVNSGITHLGVLAQQMPSSLRKHIGRGRPWDLDRKKGGVRILQPYLHRTRGQWYRGTAEALSQNLDYLEDGNAKRFLVLSGDGVYKMDYRQILAFHHDTEADVVLAVKQMPASEAHRFGIVEVDPADRVMGFEEKPEEPKCDLAFIGVYLFSRDVLLEGLAGLGKGDRGYDLVADVLLDLIPRGRVFAYRFDDYWEDVGSVGSYYRTQMDLLGPAPSLGLEDPNWPIYTRGPQMPPARFGAGARCRKALVAEGAIVEGDVIESILYPGVRVDPGARVERSIILSRTVIRPGACVRDAILDEEVVVEEGVSLAPPDGGQISVIGKREVVRS